MEIACIISTIRTTILLVRTREASIWKLLAVNVRPSGRQGNTVRSGSQTEKIFSEIFGILIAQLFVQTAYDHRPDGAQFYQARHSFETSAYKYRPLGLRTARIWYWIPLVFRELYCEIIELSWSLWSRCCVCCCWAKSEVYLRGWSYGKWFH